MIENPAKRRAPSGVSRQRPGSASSVMPARCQSRKIERSVVSEMRIFRRRSLSASSLTAIEAEPVATPLADSCASVSASGVSTAAGIV